MGLILSALALLAQWLIRPDVIICPAGWFVNGVPPDGQSRCEPDPDVWRGDGVIIEIHVRCRPDERAVILDRDRRIVGCRRPDVITSSRRGVQTRDPDATSRRE